MKATFTCITFFIYCQISICQVILTAENTPHSPSFEKFRHNIESGITPPALGADIAYDYSDLITVEMETIPYYPATREGFEDDTRFVYAISSLGPLSLFSEFYTLKTEDGISRTGSYKLPQKVDLTLFTGNNTDTLSFPGNPSYFEEPKYILKYPVTYGSNWESTYYYTTEFEITVGAFGLNKVPGYQYQKVIQKDSIVGWGTLVLPTDNGPSQPYDVLLLKEERIYTDSIFLGGQPAPAPLLSAFGLTQGGSGSVNRYFFYSPNFDEPILEIFMSSDWSTPTAAYYFSNNIVSSTTQANYISNNVYPNPISSNDIITFEFEESTTVKSIVFYDQMGRVIQNNNVPNHSKSYQCYLPNQTYIGYLFYSLNNDDNQIISTGKIIIKP